MDIIERTYVALDLETTGLSPETDEIIEIGAVRFTDGHQIDIFQSLVNPHRPVPYRIQSLCGISQDEVDVAPSFSAIAESLLSFLGEFPIVGHNISFDLGFLRQKGLKLSNPDYDTYEMARLLLPCLPERNLSAVASYLGIPHPSAHRALADAIVAKDTFTELLRTLSGIDPAIISELARLTAKTDWWLGKVLREVAEGKSASLLLGEANFERACFGSRSLKPASPLTPNPESTPLNVDELTRFFDGDGPLARHFPNYEQRPEQVEMMRAVAEAINNNQHLIVEAGTGTGKSMAYLLPAAFFACGNNMPVVISTNTINLQEQLVHKDIPDLMGTISDIGDMHVAQVKGRTNYLCLRRWDILRKSEGLPMDTTQLMARIQVWLPSTDTGDRSEINLVGRESMIWSRICAQGYDCLGRQCPYYQRGLCFLHRARKAAESAHLIVTNHALLLSEMASGAKILPEYNHLIIDEAHHFEDVATDQLGSELREQDILDHFDQIIHDSAGQRTGFLPQLGYVIRTSDMPPVEKDDIERLTVSLDGGVTKARGRVSEFFNALGNLLQNYGEGRGEYDLHLRVTGATRAQPAWSDIEIICENLNMALQEITRTLQKINAATDSLTVPDTLKLEGFSLLNSNEELRHLLDSMVFHPEDTTIYWLTLGRKSNMITLRSAPLHVGALMRNSLYSQKDCLILTGATLSVEGNFEYLKERLGIDEPEELLLGSPFDYERAALVYLASDIPEPGRAGYQEALAQVLVPLCRATEGRCLVLFTSYAALRATQAAIQGPMEKDDILVLGQGIDGAPRKLLSSLRSNPRTVLLGAASFWEGVDVVGDLLSVLVIVRLPFNVPTDPIFAARSDTFDDPFNEYTLPQTVCRFKQGFGRLIRSKDDRGVVVVLDSRLSTKSYGQVFLKSLPPCRVEKGPSRNIPNAVKGWLALR